MQWAVDLWKEARKAFNEKGPKRWWALLSFLLVAILAVVFTVFTLDGSGASLEVETPTHKLKFEFVPADGSPGRRVKIRAKRLDGMGSAELEGIILFDEASWKFGSAEVFETPAGAQLDIGEVFADPSLAARLAGYQEVWALGLVSGVGNPSKAESIELGQRRAMKLCEILARAPYLNKRSVNGVSLADNLNNRPLKYSKEEALQRSVVVFGLIKETGSNNRQVLLQDIVQQDRIFSEGQTRRLETSKYELASPGRRLEFVWADWRRSPVTCVS